MLLCTWIWYRRIHSSAEFFLWSCRTKTNLWNCFPIWTYRVRIFFRSDWTGSERCIGLCGNSWNNCIPWSEGQHFHGSWWLWFHRSTCRWCERTPYWNPKRLYGRRSGSWSKWCCDEGSKSTRRKGCDCWGVWSATCKICNPCLLYDRRCRGKF